MKKQATRAVGTKKKSKKSPRGTDLKGLLSRVNKNVLNLQVDISLWTMRKKKRTKTLIEVGKGTDRRGDRKKTGEGTVRRQKRQRKERMTETHTERELKFYHLDPFPHLAVLVVDHHFTLWSQQHVTKVLVQIRGIGHGHDAMQRLSVARIVRFEV